MANPSELVFDTGPDGALHLSVAPVLSLDGDGTILFVNDAFRTLTGLERAAVTGETLRAVVPDEHHAAIETAITTLAPGESAARDIAIRRDDGLSVPVRLFGQAEGDDGTVSRIHCQLNPRTEQETTGESLIAQNALLRTVLDELPVGVLAETANRTVLAANTELGSMFGFETDRDELIGADCVALAQQVSDQFVDPDAFVDGVESAVAAADPVSGERLERTDGRVFERTYRPVELPNGRGHLWMYEDVTEQQNRESELETYERLVEVTPVGVFRTTTDGRVLTVNQRMADILGYDSEADLLENYGDLGRDLYVDPERRRAFTERIQETGVVRDFEYEAKVRGGGRRWLSMNARLLDETDEGARVITGFTWDVTERRRHEQQLAVLGRILRHNLRNALTVIEGQAKALQTDGADAEEAIAKITDRTSSLLDLADKEREIVDILRGRTDRVVRDLCAIAETVRDDFQRAYPNATITVACPAAATATMCLGFERAISELVENAILHTESNDPAVELSISAGEGTVEIAVSDNGPGMPDVEKRILDGDVDESPLYHSAGIGLFLVRQLVRFSDGTLSFEENDPQGSVVRIQLPSG